VQLRRVPAEQSFRISIATQGDITLCTLDLSPMTEEAVHRFAENNIQFEKRDE
jgi:hypothetical protein